jgi:hypothetical protein
LARSPGVDDGPVAHAGGNGDGDGKVGDSQKHEAGASWDEPWPTMISTLATAIRS